MFFIQCQNAARFFPLLAQVQRVEQSNIICYVQYDNDNFPLFIVIIYAYFASHSLQFSFLFRINKERIILYVLYYFIL